MKPNANITAETIDLVKTAMGSPLPDEFTKSFTQPGNATSGLASYDLEAPAKTLYPVITPLRNRIARVGGGMGTAANWRAVTGINTAKLSGGVSEGNRGGILTTTTQSYTQGYKGIGFEDYVTFEADYAGKGFEDVKARAVTGLLRSTMIYEESVLLGGNSVTGLGTTGTPTVANSGTGGTIAAATYNVACVALTLEGFLNSVVGVAGVPVGPVSRTNADASVDAYGSGAAQKSATAGTTTSGATSVITASVTPMRGAVAYAWYVGTAGAERIVAITTINSVLITALPGGTNQLLSALPSSDQSVNGLVFDGLFAQVFGTSALTAYTSVGSTCTLNLSSGNSLVGQMATGTAGTGTVLTADGKGGIVEIDAMLKAFWDLYRLSPDTIYVSAQEAQNIEQKILTGNSNPAFRFNLTANQNGLMGGMAVASYLNKFAPGGAQAINIQIHPNCPAGTLLFYSNDIPYPISNVGNVIQVKTRREYYQLEWPLRSRKYEYGVYADEVLQHYFPPSLGVIDTIGAG